MSTAPATEGREEWIDEHRHATTVAHPLMTTERQACGIGAFIPMSCRGRAEAFARRLQTRLQHLGSSAGNGEHGDDTEESWLTNQSRYPTIHQPRLSSSSESDIFFDFDVDLEESPGSGSPPEEATEEIHLNNDTTAACCKEDVESGCVSGMTAQSPGSDSSEGNYYDPDPQEYQTLSPLTTLAEEGDEAEVTCNGHADCDNRSNGIRGASEVVRVIESREGKPRARVTTSRNEIETSETLTDDVDTVDCVGVGRKVKSGYAKCNGGKCGIGECVGTDASDIEVLGNDCNGLNGKLYCSTFMHPHQCVVECPRDVGMGMFLSRKKCVPEIDDEGDTAEDSTVEDTRNGERRMENGYATEDLADFGVLLDSRTDEEQQFDEPEYPVEENLKEKVAIEEVEEKTCTVAETKSKELTEVCDENIIKDAEEEICVVNELKATEEEHETSRKENLEIICKNEEELRTTSEGSKNNSTENTDTICEVKLDVKVITCLVNVKKEELSIKNREEVAAESCKAGDVEEVEDVSKAANLGSPTTEVEKVDEICQTEENELLGESRVIDVVCQTEDAELKTLIQDCDVKKAVPSISIAASDDDDDDYCPPRRVQRCSSLKTGKTPPGTPGRKKIVRFADVLGLDLADVRTFLDEIPKIPTSAYEDLPNADLTLGNSTSTAGQAQQMPLCTPNKPDRTLVPLFQQPGGCPDFLDRVRCQFVCLENAMVKDMVNCIVTGTVRVLNLDFFKSVHIRYTLDCWKTFADLQATYVANSCDGFSDTFCFTLYANLLKIGERLEFAVRFQCHGIQYWDSNHGMNYSFQCLPPSGPAPSLSLPCEGDHWASFY